MATTPPPPLALAVQAQRAKRLIRKAKKNKAQNTQSVQEELILSEEMGPHFPNHSATRHRPGDLLSLEVPYNEARILYPIQGEESGCIEYPKAESRNRRLLIERYCDGMLPEDLEVITGRWITLACPDSYYKCWHCRNHTGHVDCIIVAIDSIPPKNPNVGDKVAIGVYFGHENKKNISATYEENHCTKQVAALKACWAALTKCLMFQKVWKSEEIADDDGKIKRWPLHTIVMKSDSEYLVKGLTEWMPKWKENGWKNCKGQPVANDQLWRGIDELLVQLETKVNVFFWLVKKEDNIFANSLALAAASHL